MTTRTLALELFVFGLALGNAHSADAPNPALTDVEYAELTKLLDDGHDLLMGLVTGLTDEQWNFKQNPDRWSVAECVEHIVRSQRAQMVTIKGIIASPPDKDWYERTKGKVDIVRELVPNRPAQGQGPAARQAPDEIRPTEHWDRARGIQEVYAVNGEVRSYIETMDRAIKDRTKESSVPVFGWLNAYDWFNLLGSHVIRHSRQIAEVKADPNFPKRTNTASAAAPALLSVLASAVLSADDPNPNVTGEERAVLVQEYDNAQKIFLSLISGLTDAQWNFHENPERWSIGEVVEHVSNPAIVDGMMRVIAGPPNPNWYEETKGKLEYIRQNTPNRPEGGVGGFKAIDAVQPKLGLNGVQGIEAFYATLGKMRAFAETMPSEVKNRTAMNPFPEIGMLNVYDWMTLSALHIVRHSKQIIEIQSHADYPKSSGVALTAVHPNPNVTDEELEALRNAIDDGQRVLTGLMTGLTDEQWNFHENPDRWSIGQCVEHMARTEVAILNGIKYTAQQPPNPKWYEETNGKLDLVRKVVPDRPARGEGSPFQAGGEVLPSENWDRAKGFQEFYAAHGQLRAFVETMPREIKNRTFANPFPSIGMLNTYDWLTLASLHVIRHSKQIAELKQDAKYPK